MLPAVLRSVDLERRHKLSCTFRECRDTVDILVVPLVVDDLGIRVADTDIRRRLIAQTVLESVFLVSIEAFESDPPAACLVVTFHSAFLHAFPIVPVTYDVAIVESLSVLVLIIEDECHAAVIIIVDSVPYACRHGFENQRIRSE